MTTLLLDADIFAFAASSATEKVFYFNGVDQEPSVSENLEEGMRKAKADIEAVANKLKATRLIVCLTDTENFRYGVYPDYKGNRKNLRKPSTLRAIKDYLGRNYETYQRPGLEADDCMGILSTHKTLIPGRKVIVSDDKDMQTIPGLLFNPKKDREVRTITEVMADRYFMRQTMIGDSTDGYPGAPGIGEKSPFVTGLEECKTAREMWELVKAAYAKKGLTEKDAIVQARCARILRANDWDFPNKRVRLWTPPF
ncbi:hypothetical protein [Stenotrophomonas muris]|uniref:hypothetical protein n=1 Tax=Stenotrophomonas muris TaxID=2963283 RepID=UPI00405597C0